MWASRGVYHSRPGRHRRQYVPQTPPPPLKEPSLPNVCGAHKGTCSREAQPGHLCFCFCLRLDKGNKIFVHVPDGNDCSSSWSCPKSCLPDATLGSLHLSRDGPVIRCIPAASDPKFSGRSVALPQVQPWSLHTPSWGTAQSRQIDKGARRERRGPSRSICRRPLPRPLHPV